MQYYQILAMEQRQNSDLLGENYEISDSFLYYPLLLRMKQSLLHLSVCTHHT